MPIHSHSLSYYTIIFIFERQVNAVRPKGTNPKSLAWLEPRLIRRLGWDVKKKLRLNLFFFTFFQAFSLRVWESIRRGFLDTSTETERNGIFHLKS